MNPALLEARGTREANALDELDRLMTQIGTLQDFHRCLFTEHQCYAAQFLTARRRLQPTT